MPRTLIPHSSIGVFSPKSLAVLSDFLIPLGISINVSLLDVFVVFSLFDLSFLVDDELDDVVG